ncbi:MAG: hypothetical protein ACQRW7_05370 [Caulobacterales bacterium]|uniref:hypothetical protein n=1 Tax=Glycocaulis sp. TaxID=1969725 RepID=UPI003FA16D87
MKSGQLIMGAAIAALLSGAASAQYIQTTQYGSASTNTIILEGANPTAAGRYFLASEFPIAGQNSATLNINIDGARTDTGANRVQWDNPGAATFTINLQNTVFSSAVNATALTGRAVPQVAAAPLEAAPAATAGCLAGDITVTAGGTVGSSSVSFTVANIAACGRRLNFSSANGVQLTAANANFTTGLTRQLDGSAINGGSGTTSSGTHGAFIQQVPGIDFGGPTPLPVQPILFGGATPYDNLGVPAGINFTIFSGGARVNGNAVAVFADLTGTTMAGLASSATVSLVPPEPAGLSIAASTFNGTLFGVANAVDITGFVNLGTVIFSPSVSVASAFPGAPIQSQTISIQPTVTFTTASGIAPRTYPPVPVVRLSRQGQQTQAFTWVGDGTTTSAISVFRHTGVPASVPGIRFILSNATNGASFNGEYTVPAGAVTRSAGGEVITTSLNLSQIAGNFGRADVVWVFDLAPASPINTQRFVQAPNGTLAPAPEENALRTNAVAAFN